MSVTRPPGSPVVASPLTTDGTSNIFHDVTGEGLRARLNEVGAVDVLSRLPEPGDHHGIRTETVENRATLPSKVPAVVRRTVHGPASVVSAR